MVWLRSGKEEGTQREVKKRRRKRAKEGRTF